MRRIYRHVLRRVNSFRVNSFVNCRYRSPWKRRNYLIYNDLRFRNNSVSIDEMDQAQITKTLEELSLQLKRLAEAVDKLGIDYPPSPAWVAEKVEKRICLGCNEAIPEGVRCIRGMHERCLKALERRIEKGDATLFGAISTGKTLPPGKTGRKTNSDYDDAFNSNMVAGKTQPAGKAKPAKKSKASRRLEKP